MNSISNKVRTGHGPFWGALKQLRRRVLTCHIPVVALTKPVFALFFRLHVVAGDGLRWSLRFFWCEPLFRSQCSTVGQGFRMERLPYIVGRGTITIGNSVRLSGKSNLGFNDRSGRNPTISIGDHSFVGHDCSFAVAKSIAIGTHCLLAGGVSVRDHDGHPIDATHRRDNRPVRAEEIKPVVIGDDVWIGVGAIILKGVTIGDRAIVGAGAVVTRDVSPDSIVVGNPARVVMMKGERAAA